MRSTRPTSTLGLRRALLRKYTGQQSILATGDRCYYWRDGTAAGSKLRWKGPAIVVMREVSDAGPHADIYWIAHGTSLLRAAPEHVKPAVYKDTTATDTMDPLDRAKLALFGVRNRGMTHYTDLVKTNKRKREEIDSDEETEELDKRVLGRHGSGTHQQCAPQALRPPREEPRLLVFL